MYTCTITTRCGSCHLALHQRWGIYRSNLKICTWNLDVQFAICILYLAIIQSFSSNYVGVKMHFFGLLMDLFCNTYILNFIQKFSWLIFFFSFEGPYTYLKSNHSFHNLFLPQKKNNFPWAFENKSSLIFSKLYLFFKYFPLCMNAAWTT